MKAECVQTAGKFGVLDHLRRLWCRNRLLESHGWEVWTIPFFEYRRCANDAAKVQPCQIDFLQTRYLSAVCNFLVLLKQCCRLWMKVCLEGVAQFPASVWLENCHYVALAVALQRI